MPAEELINNQDLLVDYVWGKLDKILSDEIDHIANMNMEVSDIIDAITYLAIALNLDNEKMKTQIQSLNNEIHTRIDTNL